MIAGRIGSSPRTTVRVWSVIAVLLGLCFAQGIVYVAKVGNLYVDIVYLAAFVVLALRFVFFPKETREAISRCFDSGLLPFLLIAGISGIMAVVSAITHVGLQITSFVNGLVVLSAGLVCYCAVISLEDYRANLIYGLWAGLLVSVVVSFLQLAAFNNGGAFTFYNLFPQPAFYISVPWGAAGSWSSNSDYLIYSFRAQGLYLECSYFVSAATVIYIASSEAVRLAKTFRLIVFGFLLVLFALSDTGNITLFVIFVLLAYFMRRHYLKPDSKTAPSRRNPHEWGLFIFLAAIVSCLLIVLALGPSKVIGAIDLDSIIGGIMSGFEDSNIAGEGNEERYRCMANAIAEFLHYPWGGGYNMSSALLAYDYGTNTTFSYFLTLLVELGVFGLAAYLFFVARLVVRLLGKATRNRVNGACLACSILALLSFQAGNGSGLIPLAWCLFALSSIEVNRERHGGANEAFCADKASVNAKRQTDRPRL